MDTVGSGRHEIKVRSKDLHFDSHSDRARDQWVDLYYHPRQCLVKTPIGDKSGFVTGQSSEKRGLNIILSPDSIP